MKKASAAIEVKGANEHNLKNVDVTIPRNAVTVITGVSGSGKSSLAFDTILAESQRRFFYTLSHFSRQFLDLGSRPDVRSIGGLSPAIALAQNETRPSRRATVGTLTDISELLGVMFARFGEPLCPKHFLPTASQSIDEIADHCLERHKEATVAICAPIAEAKKGNFTALLTAFAERGFLRAYIDGEMVSLAPPPRLAKEEKHTIKLVIDFVKVKAASRDRLLRSMDTALIEGKGVGEIFLATAKGEIDGKKGESFSTKSGCPECGFSWPKLDARYFSANSLGKCEKCQGYGTIGEFIDDDDGNVSEEEAVGAAAFDLVGAERCESCRGTGIDKHYAAIRMQNQSIQDCLSMPLGTLHGMLQSWSGIPRLKDNAAFQRVFEEVFTSLGSINNLGLNYLNLSRRIRSLSGGEAQRLRLASVLGEHLRGVLYVLDEPSQGLHPLEIDRLWESIERLKQDGNTIIIVDHDEQLMKKADLIVDLGPGGGQSGGELMGTFHPRDAAAYAKVSRTAMHMSSKAAFLRHHIPKTTNNFLEIKGGRRNNLQSVNAKFPFGAMTTVTGPSGAGKSSLVLGTLFPNVAASLTGELKSGKAYHCDSISGLDALSEVVVIDRGPVAKSSVSMPATYLDIFGDLRELFAGLPEAQMRGLTVKSFSLHSEGGRCEECRGRGEVNLVMKFLSDARVPCSICHGRRYRPHMFDVRFNHLSMDQVLELTIDEALENFKNFRKIVRKLQPAVNLGLGYLKLGQPSASLSGGESQRLKMVPYLVKQRNAGSLILVDEPTTGLHAEDIQRLVKVLRTLVDQGATVVVIEHNAEVICASDWVVDIGPGSANEGGRVVYQGGLTSLVREDRSVTGKYLRPLLEASL